MFDDTKYAFVGAWNAFQNAAHSMSRLKGWWDEEDALVSFMGTTELGKKILASVMPHLDGAKIAMVQTEISEAVEGIRNDAMSDKIPGFKAVEEELADALIRIGDLAGRRGWRVGDAVVAKYEYNRGRPHRHGGKSL